MSTDEQPNRPTSRRAGPTRRLRRACPTFQRPPLVLLPGGLNLTEQGWAELQQFAADAGVDAEPCAEQLDTLARYADELAAQADQALASMSADYDRQCRLARTSHQRRATALASLFEAVTSDIPVSAEEMVALVAAARSESDVDYAAGRDDLRRLGHTHAATYNVLAKQLAALVGHLDELANAMRAGRTQHDGPHGDGSSPPNGQAS
jgi:hypothetical protein